jgi:hypothetical protein
MAKEQGISLTPEEITGMCGRLRCCLIYEYSHYHENRKLLPKRNKRVMTPVGEGKVVDVLPLKMAAIVDVPEVGRKEFNHADMIPMSQYLSQQAEKPASMQEEESLPPTQSGQSQTGQAEQRANRSQTSGEERQSGRRSKSQQRRGNARRGGGNEKDTSANKPNRNSNQQRGRRPANPKSEQNDNKS